MNRWIIFLLVFSLAVNIAVMGTLIYYWTTGAGAEQSAYQYKPPVPPRQEKPPKISKEQRLKIRQLRIEYFAKTRELRREIGMYHDELMDMLMAESFSRDSIQAIVGKIAKKQMELEQLTADHLLDLRKNMDQEQWRIFVNKLKRERPFFNNKRNKRNPQKRNKRVKY